MDIDIDTSPDFDPSKLFRDAVRASRVEKGELKPHLVGWYFQKIPKDKLTQLSAIPYDIAEDYGYKKIDILHLNLLKQFKSKEEMRKLLKIEPDWNLLLQSNIVEQLFHLSGHYDTLVKIKPRSIEELADVLALIRPGKFNLIDKYVKDKKEVRKVLYDKKLASDLRKSHAIPYAQLIVLQLHKIKEAENR
jgi:DNA polymerase III alpha subunit